MSDRSSRSPAAAWRLAGLSAVEDRIFAEWRLRFYGTGVLVGLAIAILLQWARGRGFWVIGPDGRLGNLDFCWIWVSGKFAALPDPSQIYDQAIYAASQNIYYPPRQCGFMHQYVYPPTLLFFTYLLGLLPYLLAFAVWTAGTLVLYLAAVYAILPRTAALLAALAPAVALKNLQLGQNGFLTAGLFGLSLVALERRPWLSGIFLGLLTFKPQLGVLFPVALFASRNWRAFASAAVTAAAVGIAAALAFGPQTWPAFIGSLIHRNADLSPQPGAELLLESFYGLLHSAGAGAWLAWAVHLAIAAGVTAAIYAIWRRPIPHALKAAALCISSLLISPYLLPYDLCILSIGVAFLVKDGWSRGFLAGERTAILIALVALYCLAAGPIICAALLLLVVRRILLVPGDAPLPQRGGAPAAGHAL